MVRTPAALLGAGAEVPPGRGRPAGEPAMKQLTPAECRRLIEPGGVGRIAFSTAAGPVVYPVNFAMVADTIVIRTSEGTVLEGHADEQVALEPWHLREDAVVWPWAGGTREVYLRIVPVKVTGRRIETR